MCWPIGRALQAMHGRGVLHRNLRPGNVLITETKNRDGARRSQVKLLEAGLAISARSSTPAPATRSRCCTPAWDVASPSPRPRSLAGPRDRLFSLQQLLGCFFADFILVAAELANEFRYAGTAFRRRLGRRSGSRAQTGKNSREDQEKGGGICLLRLVAVGGPRQRPPHQGKGTCSRTGLPARRNSNTALPPSTRRVRSNRRTDSVSRTIFPSRESSRSPTANQALANDLPATAAVTRTPSFDGPTSMPRLDS